MSPFILRKDQLLLEAVSASEKASIRLREFAAATLLPEQTGSDIIFANVQIAVSVETAREGYLSTEQELWQG